MGTLTLTRPIKQCSIGWFNNLKSAELNLNFNFNLADLTYLKP